MHDEILEASRFPITQVATKYAIAQADFRKDYWWGQLSQYDRLAKFIASRYNTIKNSIIVSKLDDTKTILLSDLLRQSISLTAGWFSNNDLGEFERWDKNRFDQTLILTTINSFKWEGFVDIVEPQPPAPWEGPRQIED